MIVKRQEKQIDYLITNLFFELRKDKIINWINSIVSSRNTKLERVNEETKILRKEVALLLRFYKKFQKPTKKKNPQHWVCECGQPNIKQRTICIGCSRERGALIK